MDIDVEFQGPLAWVRVSGAEFIFEADVAQKTGVYLWTVETADGFLIWYVGETGVSFHQRMKEHFKEQLSGMYMLYDPEAFIRGEKLLVWEGMYRKGEERRVPEYLEAFPAMSSAMANFAKQIRFFVASLDGEPRLRKRVEAGIAKHLYEQPGVVGQFQDTGIQYQDTRWPDEDPLSVRVRCDCVLRGLPDLLEL